MDSFDIEARREIEEEFPRDYREVGVRGAGAPKPVPQHSWFVYFLLASSFVLAGVGFLYLPLGSPEQFFIIAWAVVAYMSAVFGYLQHHKKVVTAKLARR